MTETGAGGVGGDTVEPAMKPTHSLAPTLGPRAS